MSRPKPSKRWVIITFACLILEGEALRASKKDATLSYATREVFQTRSLTGKISFALAWTALYFWFLDHILGKNNVR